MKIATDTKSRKYSDEVADAATELLTGLSPRQFGAIMFRLAVSGYPSALVAFGRPLVPRSAGAAASENPEQAFRDFARDHGVTLPDRLIHGKTHRFNPDDGGRKDDKGWCAFRGDFGVVGVWGTDIEGGVYWFAKKANGAGLSEAERETQKKQIKDAQRLLEQETKRRNKEAARKATEHWEEATPAPDTHPYLVKKGVKSYGLRLRNGDLIMPLYDADNAMHSYQSIDAEGTKRFLFGGRAKGLFFVIGEVGPGIIYIAEGYASAATIHEATGRAVVTALNCGNLLDAAKALRKKFEFAQFVFCADLDSWTGKAGERKAEEAARAIRAKVTVPIFATIRTIGKGDINDLHQAEGLDAVRKCLADAKDPPPAEVSKLQVVGGTDVHGAPKWRDVTEKGAPRTTSIANVKAAFDYLGINAWYNDFTWMPEAEGSAGRLVLDDRGVTELWRRINALRFFTTDAFVAKAWKAIARGDRRHPIRDWLDSLVWLGTKRLERLFIDYAGAPDTPYNRALGVLIGVAMVRRIRQPGYKFDHVILLRGPQDISKSLFWQVLASPAYFTDNFDFSLSSKEIIEQTARKWLVEAGEMKGLTPKQIGHIRALITRQVDSARLAFAQGYATDYPRQFAVVGTVNEHAFLHDQHGNRRFDIVDVSKIDIEALARDRDQLFADACILERTYGYLVLPDAVKADAKAVQDAALVRDHRADDIEDALDGRYGFVSRDDIYELVLLIGKTHPQRNDREISRVVKETVSRHGWREIQLNEAPRPRGYARLGPSGEGKEERRVGSPRWTKVVIGAKATKSSKDDEYPDF